ncbi:MAG TPA: DUF3857 domain-containing protein [Candidatus Sulfotelmatobacter sp.]|nr:DUF3857 domain-containing protein [Candidatus Sulfotelmatobacter sp.]
MQYESDGTGSREIRARLRVQSPSGLTKAGNLVFNYGAANEKIEIRSVRVVKPDGKVVTAGPDAVQDLSAPIAREAPMYSDAREKHVTVPGVAVGDAIEYDVITTVFQPLMAGQFWQAWNFISDAICLDEQVDLNVPSDRKLKLKSPPGIEPRIREEGSRRLYHWSASNLELPVVRPPLKDFKFDVKALLEGMRPPPPRQITFSTFQSWDEIGQWYLQLERDRRIPTPEIRAEADEIVRGRKDEAEKIQALYAWVSRSIRYVSLSFGVGRYQPHSALEVMQNRYGDCKDKATLLEAFLEAEGLHADPALVNSRAEIDPDVPSPIQFDHVITRVKSDSHEYWMDSTIGVAPFGYLLPQLRGKSALVARSDSLSGLTKTPEALPGPTIYKFDVQGEFTEDGHLDMALAFDTRGDLEVLLRLGILTLPPAQFMAIMQSAAREQAKTKSSGDDFRLHDFKAGDPTDTSTPFHLQLSITTKIAVPILGTDETRGSAREAARAFSSGIVDQETLLAFLPGVEAKSNGSRKAGQKAVKLGGPTDYALSVAFSLPGKAQPGSGPPEHFQISKDFAEYQSDAEWEGRTLRASWRLALRVPEVPQDRAAEYASFCQEVVESFTSHVSKSAGAAAPPAPPVLEKPIPSRPPHTPLPEAETLYNDAQAEIKRQNWGNAERSLESAVRLDPEYASAWNSLGRARMALGKYSDAEAAFRNLLALAPENAFAYTGVAWSLALQRKYSEGAEFLEQRVAAAPEDPDAHMRLGVFYIELHHPDKAVAELEKATSYFSKSAFAYFNLGRAYLENQQGDKAVQAFDEAISLQGGANFRNDAAYLLAEKKSHLDSARVWSTESIRSVEIELNQITIHTMQARTLVLLNEIGAFWDTLGWIDFHSGDFPSAEKNARAASQLLEDSTVLDHLARIYEVQGRKDDAAETYAEAVALIPTTREINDDEKDARERLVRLLGNDSLVANRVKQARTQLRSRRSIPIPNPSRLEGIAQYILIVGPGSKVVEIQSFTSDNPLEELTESVRSAIIPQTFPDSTIQKMPRAGTLACPRSDQPCTFTLQSGGGDTRPLPPPGLPLNDR